MLLLGVSSAAAETERTTQGQAQIAATEKRNDLKPGKADVLKKNSSSFTKETKQKPSAFVLLGQLILNDMFVFNDFNDFAANAFDPDITGRILSTRETKWAFGHINTSRHLDKQTLARGPSKNAIEIKPLGLDFGSFNPFFGDFFKPLIRGRYTLSSEDMAPFDGMAGFEVQPLFAAEENGTDFTASTSRTPFAYSYALDKKTSVNAGVGWIPYLGDTKGFSKALEDPGAEGSSDKLSGVNLSLGASYKAFTLTGGYVRALDNRTSAELALEGKENDPIAWNSEIAYSTELLSKETTLAVGYQKSSDALQYYLPEERYRTRASMAFSDSTTFSLEYYQDKEYAAKNGEDSGYGITTRIGFDF
jgi:hypothetical protein